MADGNPVNDALFNLAKQGMALSERMAIADGSEDAGVFTAIKTITVAGSPYAITPHDGTVFVDTSGGAVTVVLPTAVGIGGREYTLNDNGNAETNQVTVNTTGSETISDETSLIISTDHVGVVVQSDGSNWQVVSTAIGSSAINPSYAQMYEDNVLGTETNVSIPSSGSFVGWTNATGNVVVSSDFLSFVGNVTADRILTGVYGRGVYLVSYNCVLGESSNRNFVGIALFKNGVQATASFAIGRTDQNGEGGGGGNSIMVFLEAGDYIDFRFSASDNVTLDVWQVTATIVRVHA